MFEPLLYWQVLRVETWGMMFLNREYGFLDSFLQQISYNWGSWPSLFGNWCRCLAGYYGDPIIGSGDHCRPCPCPDGPDSGRQFASSCYQDPVTLQLACVCNPGYIGKWCADFRRKRRVFTRLVVKEEKRWRVSQFSCFFLQSLIKSEGNLKYRRCSFPVWHVG